MITALILATLCTGFTIGWKLSRRRILREYRDRLIELQVRATLAENIVDKVVEHLEAENAALRSPLYLAQQRKRERGLPS